MKPICVVCQRFFRLKKTGFYFLEGMPRPGTDTRTQPVGRRAPPESWQPYKLWAGDEWECPDCHATIIVGTGQRPVDEHYTATFAERVAELNAHQLLVKDC